jgi:hypothetical protein
MYFSRFYLHFKGDKLRNSHKESSSTLEQFISYLQTSRKSVIQLVEILCTIFNLKYVFHATRLSI